MDYYEKIRPVIGVICILLAIIIFVGYGTTRAAVIAVSLAVVGLSMIAVSRLKL